MGLGESNPRPCLARGKKKRKGGWGDRTRNPQLHTKKKKTVRRGNRSHDLKAEGKGVKLLVKEVRLWGFDPTTSLPLIFFKKK